MQTWKEPTNPNFVVIAYPLAFNHLRTPSYNSELMMCTKDHVYQAQSSLSGGIAHVEN
ncbi:MAG: hypothetical protein K2Q18_12560 [Bdellovibrionales bacterium]|nr:hypothetical protein [Bdellovibrionales bacterium]